MPVRNIIKIYGAEQYYHVYTRGVNKQAIFLDSEDYTFFLQLLARYLSDEPTKSPARIFYPHFGKRMELLAFCLMPNHVHLLVYQSDEKAMAECMRAIMTSYSIHFNKKYDRRGPLFESHYLASLIGRDSYLQHISRYIHLNPREWQHYAYSSLPYYLGSKSAEWIKPTKILEVFNNSPKLYLEFVKDYENQKAMLDELKYELAHD